jgi:hypothetical protein
MSKAIKWCGRFIRRVRDEEFTLSDGSVWEREVWEYADGLPPVGMEGKEPIMFFKKVGATSTGRKHPVKSRQPRPVSKPQPVDIRTKIRGAIKPYGGGS